MIVDWREPRYQPIRDKLAEVMALIDAEAAALIADGNLNPHPDFPIGRHLQCTRAALVIQLTLAYEQDATPEAGLYDSINGVGQALGGLMATNTKAGAVAVLKALEDGVGAVMSMPTLMGRPAGSA